MSGDLKEYIAKAVDGPLSRQDAENAFTVIMEGNATPSQIGGFFDKRITKVDGGHSIFTVNHLLA